MLRPLHKPRSPLPLLTPPQVMMPLHPCSSVGSFFEVPEAYPKGAEGRLVNDKRFIREPEDKLVNDIRNACARNTNPRAKPKASDTKSDLIYKRVFGNFL